MEKIEEIINGIEGQNMEVSVETPAHKKQSWENLMPNNPDASKFLKNVETVIEDNDLTIVRALPGTGFSTIMQKMATENNMIFSSMEGGSESIQNAIRRNQTSNEQQPVILDEGNRMLNEKEGSALFDQLSDLIESGHKVVLHLRPDDESSKELAIKTEEQLLSLGKTVSKIDMPAMSNDIPFILAEELAGRFPQYERYIMDIIAKKVASTCITAREGIRVINNNIISEIDSELAELSLSDERGKIETSMKIAFRVAEALDENDFQDSMVKFSLEGILLHLPTDVKDLMLELGEDSKRYIEREITSEQQEIFDRFGPEGFNVFTISETLSGISVKNKDIKLLNLLQEQKKEQIKNDV